MKQVIVFRSLFHLYESSEMFSQFSELPYELRRKIWRQHIPGPRVVRARYDVGTGQILPGSAPPVLLHVCLESRGFLLSNEIGFTLRFSTSENPPLICVNVKTDAVQMDYDAFLWNAIEGAQVRGIIHLELYGATLHNQESANVLDQIAKFQDLETLSLVAPRAPLTEPLDGQIRDNHDRWVEWVLTT